MGAKQTTKIDRQIDKNATPPLHKHKSLPPTNTTPPKPILKGRRTSLPNRTPLTVTVPPNSLEGYSMKVTDDTKTSEGGTSSNGLASASAPAPNTSANKNNRKDFWAKGTFENSSNIPDLPKEVYTGSFEEHWQVKGEVGCGATSRVYICMLKNNPSIKAACKIVNKNRLGFGRRKKKVLEHIRNEIVVLKSLNHPCIIRMLASYECDDYIHIVTELMEGGELFEYIVDEASELTEKTAVNIVCRVARALHYMHAKGVLHRDLKPENLLLRHPGDPSEIKIIDFGFSKNCERTQSFLGTHGYLAPEMMAHEEYTTAVDMWALGVCAYALLSGYLPFDEMEPPEPGCEIEWVVQFPDEQWSEITEEGKDLIRRLLEPDPLQRYVWKKLFGNSFGVLVWCVGLVCLFALYLFFIFLRKNPPFPRHTLFFPEQSYSSKCVFFFFVSFLLFDHPHFCFVIRN
jgi:tRNA A-37 threonylcarbamoyl transferase component Bud32